MNRTMTSPDLIALMTLLRKECLRFLRIWTQTLLPPAITMALYFIIFVKFIALLFTHMHLYHPIIVVSMALLSAMVFSLAGLINGIYAKRFDDISFIPTFVLTPLTYLGGVFYSIHQLPPVWRSISLLNP